MQVKKEDIFGKNPDLIEVAGKYERNSWNQAVSDYCSWDILKHFSHLRENLIQWLPLKNTDQVLEIGAQCGALTTFLAEKTAKVTCVEKNEYFCEVNAVRTKGFSNIEIKQGTLREEETEKFGLFNWIFLIGVLPIAGQYIEKENPYEEMLKFARSHLAAGGKIVLALENRMGLKYWAGCQDEYTGDFFSGLEGYLHDENGKTFTKKELQELILKAGDFQTTFFYPYPDYILPLTIYSDAYLPKKGELSGNYCNYDRIRLWFMEEAKVYDTLIENQLFPQFANSYLIILEETEK